MLRSCMKGFKGSAGTVNKAAQQILVRLEARHMTFVVSIAPGRRLVTATSLQRGRKIQILLEAERMQVAVVAVVVVVASGLVRGC